jgi:putative PIN family toxin of toxin-antitoxin system
MQAVIDTNVLVSALISRNGKPSEIVRQMLNRAFETCYDYRMMTEYVEVLHRKKFSFIKAEIDVILDFIESDGLTVLPPALDTPFEDESDKAFYEVAVYCAAQLITGNKQHFPDEPFIYSPAEFLEAFSKT